VIALAFDDGFLNNRGPWLAAAALAMIAGAVLYARARTRKFQVAALLCGATLANGLAFVDRAAALARFGGGVTITDAAWVLILWLAMVVLMLAPLAALSRWQALRPSVKGEMHR
jgi:hypothetical protein